ncbi:MAG: hypothetical protein O7F17_09530 [Planctomycetota bacterium]|nr:hypothetical protein [Planctomycetota bacterium]
MSLVDGAGPSVFRCAYAAAFVSSLSRLAERVAAFYNQRGKARMAAGKISLLPTVARPYDLYKLGVIWGMSAETQRVNYLETVCA